jgi:oxygen-independent coproporphyrinogen-3 oxidase
VKGKYDDELAERYIDALVKEIQLRTNPGYIIDTIYIGGGSPSLLNEKQVSNIVDCLHKYFQMGNSIEFTIEMNPEDVTFEKLNALRKAGINRLSIGVQSFMAQDLQYLKRTHDARQAVSAVENALACDFANINLDFIISLPGQNKETLAANFSFLQQYDIPHISAYLLEDVEEGEEKETRDHELYFYTVEHLSALGYSQYEVSNFSKTGYRCRHNLKYWENRDYMGIGLSSSGYEKEMDYKNTGNLKRYFEKINAGQLPQTEAKKRDPTLRGIVMGLRLLEGIPITNFENHPEQLEFLLSNDLFIRKGSKIAVNPGKILLLNEILMYFIPPMLGVPIARPVRFPL